jgi:inner membrane protein
VLDAMTNGGLGVAFFSPLNAQRYFFSYRPIQVSPIGIGHFFNGRGLSILMSEVLWIWWPALVFAALIRISQWCRRADAPPLTADANHSPGD